MDAGGLEEGVRDPAADADHVRGVAEVAEDRQLLVDLRPAEHDAERRRRLLGHARQVVDLAFEQQPRDRRKVLRDANDRCVGAVRGAEGVADVDIGEPGQLAGELGIVRLFLDMEADVFQQQHLAVLHGVDRCLDLRSDAVVDREHGLIQQPGEVIGDGTVTQRVHDLPVGPPAVREDDDLRAGALQRPDRRDRLAEAEVVEDPAVLELDVVVDPQQDALALEVDVVNRLLLHAQRLRPGEVGKHRLVRAGVSSRDWIAAVDRHLLLPEVTPAPSTRIAPARCEASTGLGCHYSVRRWRSRH